MVGIMPQDIVAGGLSDIDHSTAAHGNVGQAPSLYYPKRLLLKMPYRFIRGYQFLARSSACLLCGWFHSMDLQRRRP
jgi:hypothetical protein